MSTKSQFVILAYIQFLSGVLNTEVRKCQDGVCTEEDHDLSEIVTNFLDII